MHFGDQQVFDGATTYAALMFLDKAGTDQCDYVKVTDLEAWQNEYNKGVKPVVSSVPADRISASEWNFTVGKRAELFQKLSVIAVQLGDVAHIFVGTQTSADDIFVLDDCEMIGKQISGYSRSLGKRIKIESACTYPFLRGKQIRRYEPLVTGSRMICPYEITADNSRLIGEAELERRFPKMLNYLIENKSELASREKGKFSGRNWFAFGYPKSMTLFQKSKIIVPDYNNVASFTFDEDKHFFKTGYGIILKKQTMSPFYILGLINSPLLFLFLKAIGTSLRGGYIRFWTQYIEQLPIRDINFSDLKDKNLHDRMVRLVESMLMLHKHKSVAKTQIDRDVIQRQIDATDGQINNLVYELYFLSQKEIDIIEDEIRNV